MHSQVLDVGLSSAADGDERARFLASMAEGLHAMAQPLTILRSSVAASAAPGILPTQQRRYLDLSTEQVQRACFLFEHLQDLVIANQIEAECAPVDIASLVLTVAGDQKVAIQRRGVELDVLMPGNLPNVLGDADRTLQAIQAGLKVAARVSTPGDVIEMAADVCNQLVELIIRNGRVHGVCLGSSERLSLSLAQTNILSQRGEYEYAENPFSIRLALRPLPAEP